MMHLQRSRSIITLPIVAITTFGCGPSEQLIEANAAKDAAQARASEARIALDELQDDLSSLESDISQWEAKNEAARSEILSIGSRSRKLTENIPAHIIGAVEQGRYQDIDPKLTDILIEEIAEVLEPAAMNTKAIRATIRKSKDSRFIPADKLATELETVLRPTYEQAISLDQQAQEELVADYEGRQRLLQSALQTLRVATPLTSAHVVATGDVRVTQLPNDLDKLQSRVTYYESRGRFVPVDAWRSITTQRDTVRRQQSLVETSRGQYTGMLELDCYVCLDGSFVEKSLVDKLRSATQSMPRQRAVNVELAKEVIRETAVILATGHALGQYSDQEDDEVESRRMRVDAALEALIAFDAAHHSSMTKTCDSAIEESCVDLPEALLVSLRALIASGSLASDSAVLSVAEAYPQSLSEGQEGLTALLATYRKELDGAATAVVESLDGQFEIYSKAREGVGERLLEWQSQVDATSLTADQYQLPSFRNKRPRTLQRKAVFEKARRAILAKAAQDPGVIASFKEVTKETQNLISVVVERFDDADRDLESQFARGTTRARAEASKASRIADGREDPGARPQIRFEQAAEFEAFLKGMDWYPEATISRHDEERSNRELATRSLKRSQSVFGEIRDELSSTELPRSMQTLMDELRSARETVAALDDKTTKVALQTRRSEARSAARSAFIDESLTAYFSRTAARWTTAHAGALDALESLLENTSDATQVVQTIGTAKSLTDEAFKCATDAASFEWTLPPDLDAAIQDADLDSQWNRQLAEAASAASKYVSRYDEGFERWASELLRISGEQFSPDAVVASEALEWWTEASKNQRRSTRTADDPPQVRVVQVAPHPLGALVVCTWPFSQPRRSGIREMSALYLLGGRRTFKVLKQVQGPLAVTTDGTTEFEVVSLSGVEEWSGERLPGRRAQHLSGYRPEEGAVIYNSRDQRDNSANRRRGGPLTKRMVAALRLINIPTSEGRGAAWTNADTAAMLIRRSWPELSKLKSAEVDGECSSFSCTLGSQTLLGAVHFTVPGGDDSGYLYTFRSDQDPMALITSGLGKREPGQIKYLRVKEWAIFLGAGSIFVARTDGAAPVSSPPTSPSEDVADEGQPTSSITEADSRALFEQLIKSHCFTPSGAYRGMERGVSGSTASALRSMKTADPGAFSAFAQHCRKFADSPDSFMPEKTTSSYRRHVKSGILQLSLFIADMSAD